MIGIGFLNLDANCCRSISIRLTNNKNPNHIKRNGSKIIPKEGNKIPIAIENAITIRRIESSLSKLDDDDGDCEF
jgi:hypothetical protein